MNLKKRLVYIKIEKISVQRPVFRLHSFLISFIVIANLLFKAFLTKADGNCLAFILGLLSSVFLLL